MKRLSALLEQHPESVPVLIDGRHPPVQASDLLSRCPAQGLDLDRVDLSMTEAREALHALIALEGRARLVSLGPTGDATLSLGDGDVSDRFLPAGAPRTLDTRYLMHTSGTTGTPKQVPYTLDDLMRATSTAVRGGRWGLLYAWDRFAGLQVVLQSLASSGTLLAPPATAGAVDRVAFLIKHNCDHLSATPSLYRQLLMVPDFIALELKHVTLGGEIADQAILNALRRAFPDARISHIFASTEAGVAFAVRDGREGFPASLLDSPPASVELDVRDDTLWVRPHNGTWADTGDVLSRVGDRYLFVGRRSGSVNVGGALVHPESLERFLLLQPHVGAVQVDARPNPVLGHVLLAAVVPTRQHPADLPKRLLAACRAELPRYLVPARISLVDQLKVNSAGKVTRV